jgi:membrane protein required for beta-lactamase induction
MTMLAILLGVILERFINHLDQFRTYQWFVEFAQWTRQRFEQKPYWNDTVAVLGILLIPVFVTGVVHRQLDNLFTLFGFAFSVIILLYCFGPRDLHEAARHFIHARERDDEHSAREYAATIIGEPLPEHDSELFAQIGRALLIATNQRLLAVFFWFVVLGPMGAILYRLSSILLREASKDYNENGNGFLQTTRLLFAILNWIPAHLTAFCYAVIGSFVDAMHEWKRHKSFDVLDPDAANNMLVCTGLGSLRMDADSISFDQSSLQHILELGFRTTVVWLTVLALITMAGWAA